VAALIGIGCAFRADVSAGTLSFAAAAVALGTAFLHGAILVEAHGDDAPMLRNGLLKLRSSGTSSIRYGRTLHEWSAPEARVR
jgi:hypothetical protein